MAQTSSTTITVTIDAREFERRFSQLAFHKVPGVLTKGAGDAAVALMMDTIIDMPSTPLLYGPLRSSGAVFEHCNAGRGARFGNRFRRFAPKSDRLGQVRAPMGKGSAFKLAIRMKDTRNSGVYRTQMLDEKYLPGEVGATVLFNAPYAAKWHEMRPRSGKFSFPGADMKYLETKLLTRWEKYIYIIAERLGKALI